MAADDDKKLILARRAKFVAAALAGVSVACVKDPAPPPQPCLSVPMEPRDATSEPPPQPCLTPVMAPEDAGAAPDTTTSTDAGSSKDASLPPPKPTPCLAPPLPTTTGPKPHPQPCLTPVRPPDPKKQ